MEDKTIVCPNCQKEIPLSDAVLHRFKEEFKKQSDEELEQKRLELEKSFEEEKENLEKEAIRKAREASESAIKNLQDQLKAKDTKLEKEKERLSEEITKRTREEVTTEIKDLKNRVEDQQKKLDDAQRQELELRKERRELEESKKNLELNITRRLDAEREKIRTDTAKSLTEEYRLKDLEKEKQINDMRIQIEDLKRKAEQGSQQTQGEVLELELEELLSRKFPIDDVEPVPKGIKGADVVQTVHDKSILDCGKIIWESKRTKAWGNDWIAKLKDDQREVKADIAVLVTTVLPKEIKKFGMLNGIWVTDFQSVEGLACALRAGLVQIAVLKKASVGKNEKVEALYGYLTGPEFKQKIEAIVEAFSQMKVELDQEKRVFTKVWSRREKQIDRIVNNTIGLYGDVQDLAGNKLPQIENLEPKSLIAGIEEETEANESYAKDDFSEEKLDKGADDISATRKKIFEL